MDTDILFENYTKTKLLVEQHIHGAFGIDFNNAQCDDFLYVAKKLLTYGIGGFFPTLVTDSITNISRQISEIKKAIQIQKESSLKDEMADILGIHLEGIFLNPKKKGIHNEDLFLPLTIESYKLIEDDLIKIITLAPELDEGLIDYLKSKNIKIQAGHCVSGDLSRCNAVTHLFNAMEGISHRSESTALSALINDNIYNEIIADGIHISDKALRLALKSKPKDKIILISDALPIAKSSQKKAIFADSQIYYDGIKATSKDGTIAGSTNLLDEIIHRLKEQELVDEDIIKIIINNPYEYHHINIDGSIYWDEDFNIIVVEKGTNVIHKGDL